MIVSHVIVLFDFIEEMHAKGEPFEQAVIDAGIIRLRPVLITVGATVLALFPLLGFAGWLWLQGRIGSALPGAHASAAAPILRSPDAVVQTLKSIEPPHEVKESRPICRYPNYPRYTGGDAKQAASYTCTPSMP